MLVFVVALAALTALGCAAAPAPASRPQRQPSPALHDGPLTDYIAAAGLRWMVVGRPAELASNSRLERALRPLLPAARLDAYARGTGVDLRTLKEALIAGFDFSTLYLAKTRDAAVVRRRFEARLVSGPVLRTPHPRIAVVSGIVGQTPETLVAIHEQLVALAVGDPTPARVVQAFAQRRLSRSPPALRGSALRTLPRALDTAPLRFYAPGPFRDEWARGAHGILAAAFAVGVGVRPIDEANIEATLAISGDYEGSPEAVSRLAESWSDLASSSTGRLLGLHRPAREPVVSESDGVLILRVLLELQPIVRGLHAAVIADVWEILDLSPDDSQH